MLGAISNCTNFNGKVDGWVHSGVTNIKSILISNTSFNQDLENIKQ